MKKIFFLLPLVIYQFSAFSTNLSHFLEDEKNTIKIFQKTAPSVVFVSNIQFARRSFFDLETVEIPSGGAGSGYVWDKKGHIVTNFHVISRGDKFVIQFHKDPKKYEAVLVGSEPKKDIAVLRLKEKPKNLIPITVGNSKNLIVGQKALAIGNPFGLNHTLTTGTVSALERKIEGIGGVTIAGMIQSDCSINPGNSGGPLLNSQGQMIGMNTLIYSKSGSSSGVGFSVPINTISSIVPQLIKYGKVIRPGLGITLLENYYALQMGIEKGVAIRDVPKSSSAYKAGLRGIKKIVKGGYLYYSIGDIILKINNKKVNSFDDVYHILDNHKVGDTVSLTYLRKNKIKKIKIKLQKI